MNSLPILPLSGTVFKNYWRLLKENDFDVSHQHRLRLIYSLAVSTFATTPVSFIESQLKKSAINSIRLPIYPVFIIGHWRSGTTFLHYLMAQDKQFSYLSNVQAFCPGYMFYHVSPLVRAIIRMHIPKKRPMDDITLTLDSPQEEEFALANLGHQSCYHWWYFPKKMQYYFEKYVLMKGLTKKDSSRLEATYRFLLKKIMLASAGRRLLLKNPSNTGRIPFLLNLFPDARFIYLHRHPDDVYHSTVKLHTKLIENFSLQKITLKRIEENSKLFYGQLLDKYAVDKYLIPKENLVEIGFNELTKRPLQTIQHLYSSLNINGFDDAIPNFRAFIESQKNYRPQFHTTMTQSEAVIT